MATDKNNPSSQPVKKNPAAVSLKIGIVTARWNTAITKSLLRSCLETLQKQGLKSKNIFNAEVPGSFELPAAAKWMAEKKKPDAVICLGCIIKGETPHFDFISEAVANGIMQLNIQSKIPFIFGVLTTNTMEQAKERTGGKHGDKGAEAALSAIHMVLLNQNLRK